MDPDAGELTARGGVAGNTMRASGLCLPFADGAFDVTYSSNVLEHVPDPEGMVAEMVRVTRPGGTVVVSWTPWLSPWGVLDPHAAVLREVDPGLDLVDMLPRYHPAWARWVVHVPGLREVVSWNVMLVVRPR